METNLKTLVEEVFRPLAGVPCWNVKRGYGSFLTLEFGAPYLEVRDPRPPKEGRSEKANRLLATRGVYVHGDWHLWIYCCNWRVFQGETVAGKSTSHLQMDNGARALDGQILTGIEVDLSAGIWNFQFDLGGCLATQRYARRSRYYAEDKEQWLLYQPDRMVLTVRADGKYSHQHGETRPSEERWHDPGEPLQWRIDLRE
jgi:hypothetical protein